MFVCKYLHSECKFYSIFNALFNYKSLIYAKN
jgi:hypothetical protein